MKTLSERIASAMQDAGISQAELARRCGIKQPSVSGWLNGKSKYLRGENLLRAAQALGVDEHWLATGEGSRKVVSSSSELQQASQLANLTKERISDAVRIAHYVRDAALTPIPDELFIQVLTAAIEIVAEDKSVDLDLNATAKKVAAKVRSK